MVFFRIGACMNGRLRSLLVAGALWLVAAAASAQDGAGRPAGVRVALIIGNGGYAHVSRLPNPPRDAALVAQALREVGFTSVRLENDLDRDGMGRVLAEFAEVVEGADWAVIYYAGHGIEVGGTNYLVPVDARLASDRDVAAETVRLDDLLARVDGARRLRVVMLDACRDNPFIRQMRRTLATRAVGRGLALIEPRGSTLVSYAARAGQLALDGEGANSPYVAALVRHLVRPGLEISRLFRLVRDEVLEATGREQEPFVYGSLGAEDFYFRAP
jgi:uncharacterized caspase-like protein